MRRANKKARSEEEFSKNKQDKGRTHPKNRSKLQEEVTKNQIEVGASSKVRTMNTPRTEGQL